MYQNLLHLTDELCINATGKSNTKKSIGCMSEDTQEVTVGTTGRNKLGM
jgi:hypothetical protein